MLDESAFEVVDKNGIRKVEGNKFMLFAGTSQPDELSEKLTGTKCLSLEINI
jgi:beta-glucosidase